MPFIGSVFLSPRGVAVNHGGFAAFDCASRDILEMKRCLIRVLDVVFSREEVGWKRQGMHLTDAQLLDECRGGNQRAWDALVRRYGRLVYSVPQRYGLNDSDCDDVFAGVWAAAFRHLGQLRDDTRLSAWLITTAHRESWRVGKKRPGSQDLNDRIADVASPSDDQVEQWEQQHMVRQAMHQLGGPCQELLSALFLSPGVPSYEAIAARLKIPVGSIGPTRARCFKKLRKILEDMGFSREMAQQYD